MHLIKSLKIKLLLCSFIPLFLQANEQDILSKDRLQLFELNQNKVDESTKKLKKDWINPITYKYSKNYGESADLEKSMITVNQPIFKSGGIYKAIEYAKSSQKYSTLDIDIQRKNLIKDAYTLLFNINKTNYEIKRSKIQVKNANIDINRKKEQVLNGFLDASFLDNAILDANKAKITLADLEQKKKEQINSFNNFASSNYESFDLPSFDLIDEENYLEKNLELSKTKADIDTKYQYKGVTLAKYLPSVNATFDYTKNHSSTNNLDDNVKNYGIAISVPLDVRTFNDIEVSQIDYLTAKLNLKNKILEEKNFYKSKLAKIDTINSKITITKEDYKLYDSLLSIMIEESDAGLKTASDVQTLQNSQKIKALDLKIYKIDKQIELLEVYAKLK